MNIAVRKVIFFMGSLWIAIPFCLLLHEGSHALVAIIFGGSITAFSVVEAYVIVDGGHFTTKGIALFHLAGVLLPTIAWAIYVFFYKERKEMFRNLLAAVYSSTNLFAVGVWIVVPIKERLGCANPLDDVVKFITVTNIDPIVIAGVSSVIWLFLFLNAWQKGIFINAIKELKKN